MAFKKFDNTITELSKEIPKIEEITNIKEKFTRISTMKETLESISDKMKHFKLSAEETNPDQITFGPIMCEKILQQYKVYEELTVQCAEKYDSIKKGYDEVVKQEEVEQMENKRKEEEEQKRIEEERVKTELKMKIEKENEEKEKEIEMQKQKENELALQKQQEEIKKQKLEEKRKEEEDKTMVLQKKIEEENKQKEMLLQLENEQKEFYLHEYIKKYPIIAPPCNYLPDTHIPQLPTYGEQEVTQAEFNEILYQNKSKLIVIDWYMDGCPPCRMIAPFFSSLAISHPRSVFLRVNGPVQRVWSGSQGIQSFPTFQFYLNGGRVDQFSGANKDKLQQLIEKYESQLSPLLIQKILTEAVEGLSNEVKTVSDENKKLTVSEAYKELKAKCSPIAFSGAVTTIGKLLKNILSHPTDAKFRTVKKTNQAFVSKVSSLPGSIPLLHAVGFKDTIEDELECYTFDSAVVNTIQASIAILEGQTAPVPQPQQPQPIPPMPQGFPGMGGNPFANNPSMIQMAQQMMQNPQMMQMAQQFSSGGYPPDMNSLMNSPQMMQMAQQMMQDPQMMQMAQQMMANPELAQQMMGRNIPGSAPGMNPFGNPNPYSAQPPASTFAPAQATKPLSQMSEEELIAEAMRLSNIENEQYQKKEEEKKKPPTPPPQ